MHSIIYDTTFTGFLTAVFEVYEYKFSQPDIRKEGAADTSLFGKAHHVHSHDEKARRVLKKLKQHLSPEAMQKIYSCFLSEIDGIENVLFRFIQYALQSAKNIEQDYSNANIVYLQKICRKVNYEAHRMTGFIRFQQSHDGLFFATIEPDHNILPLITKHFTHRFANQQWLIYDQKRNYGIYYNLKTLQEVVINTQTNTNGLSIALHEDEVFYQQLWKQYFKSTYNPARKNTKLHIQFLPKRYWKHLTEKMIG